MATLEVELPEDLMIALERLSGEVDEVVEATLKAGAEIVEQQVRTNLTNAIGSGTKKESRSTGQLLEALGISPVKASHDGWDIKIGFSEGRTDGRSNDLIAKVLEYGKPYQARRPFMKPAERAAKKKAEVRMREVFTEAVEKLTK